MLKMVKVFVSAVLFFALTISLIPLVFSAEAAALITLRFAGQTQPNHPATKAMEQIAKEVDQ